VFRGGRLRRRLVALIGYYVVVIVVVGPMCLSRASADPAARVPMLVTLNVAMRTSTADVATFSMPFPMTVGMPPDGIFTIPRDRLAFSLIEIPIETPRPGLGRLTVRVQGTTDFAATVDTTSGTVTLDGSLELLWSKPGSVLHPNQSHMRDCPVGPFAVHLSSATVGGTPLSQQSLLHPTSRTARLVDDNLSVRAVPRGTRQCAGLEDRLNQALSLPIVPKAEPTTTTTATTTTTTTSTSTSTTVPASTTSTDASATTSTSTTTTVTPTTSAITAATPAFATTGGNPPTAPIADGFGVALDPAALTLEPIPSIVSTLTIASVPPDVRSTTTPSTRPFVSTRQSTPTSVAPVRRKPNERRRTVATATRARPKHRGNKHAQTDAAARATTTTTVASFRTAAPPLYFSPFNFGQKRISPPAAFLAPGPLYDLGASAIAHHRTALSILFVALLLSPLAAFGLGLVASDFGWRPPFRRRRRPASTIRKSSS
jgi:hypothetical protein